jgi:hypothetical protein
LQCSIQIASRCAVRQNHETREKHETGILILASPAHCFRTTNRRLAACGRCGLTGRSRMPQCQEFGSGQRPGCVFRVFRGSSSKAPPFLAPQVSTLNSHAYLHYGAEIDIRERQCGRNAPHFRIFPIIVSRKRISFPDIARTGVQPERGLGTGRWGMGRGEKD